MEFDSDYCYCDFGNIPGNSSSFVTSLLKDTCVLHFVSDKGILKVQTGKMGGRQTGGILKKSTLGCVLSHWKDIGGYAGGSVNKKTLIK